MNSRLLKIRLRRAELCNRIADQRNQISRLGKQWQWTFDLADKGYSIVLFLRKQPLLSGVMVAILLVRRHGLWHMARTTWGLWRGFRVLRGFANRWLQEKNSTQG